MISVLLLLTTRIAGSAPAWLEQSFEGRPGSRWSATVAMDRPGMGTGVDTGKACREGTSERLDFEHGSHFLAGDSAVFLDAASKTAWVGPRRRFPNPPDAKIEILRTESLLGRQVQVVEIHGPMGHGRRIWVDTTLPLVLRSEPLQAEHRGPERQFLSLRPGIPCPAGSFRIPAGWAVKQGPPPPPKGSDGRPDPWHRRHEVGSSEELSKAVGFLPPPPPWLPEGFSARSWAWVETRQGKAAQILFGDGSRSVSIFYRQTEEPPPICPPQGCPDRHGRTVYFGRVGKFGLAATGDLPPDQLEKVVGVKK